LDFIGINISYDTKQECQTDIQFSRKFVVNSIVNTPFWSWISWRIDCKKHIKIWKDCTFT